MAGKHGVKSTKKLMSVAKLGAISILQQIAKDGWQATDLLAPVKSPTFVSALQDAAEDFVSALPEVMELDFWDGIELSKHGWAIWDDLKTEWKLAAEKIKKG